VQEILLPASTELETYGYGMARKLPPSSYLKPAPASAGRRSLVNVFGTPRAHQWEIPLGGSDTGLRAAQLQHQAARQLRDSILLSEWGSLAEFARQHDGVSYDRLRGILSGDVWMRFDDIAQLSLLLMLDPQLKLLGRGE
jgi:hypothetical protein